MCWGRGEGLPQKRQDAHGTTDLQTTMVQSRLLPLAHVRGPMALRVKSLAFEMGPGFSHLVVTLGNLLNSSGLSFLHL